jgi:hypothetical protein
MLNVAAPEGSHFEIEKVENKAGAEFQVPILVWDSFEKGLEFYTEEGILRVLDGTSLRVTFQGIARRMAIAGKSADEIASAQIEFRPGSRRVGESTPVSRSVKAVKSVAAADPAKAEALEKLLAKVAAGEVSLDDLSSLL